LFEPNRWNAISAPSGDQSGAKSDALLLVTFVCEPPVAVIRKTSLLPVRLLRNAM
jgi:hypothetical protein